MSAEDPEKQALLEKIRQDMAATRERLRLMRESKKRGTILLPPGENPVIPPQTSVVQAQSSFSQASDVIAKLKAERAKKKEDGSEVIETNSTVSEKTVQVGQHKSSEAPKKVVIVRKKADGTEERIVKEVDVGSDGNLLGPDGKVLRVRKVSVADQQEAGIRSRPSIDIGSSRLSRVINPTQATDTPVSALPKPGQTHEAAKKAFVSRAGATGKNIRSLEDLQKAIQKADRVKQQAQAQGKIEQLRRDREERKKKLTPEEKRVIRQSKRITMEFKNSETRVQVDQQIGKFMKMMEILETEWQKGEEQRLKREEEWSQQKETVEKAAEQMTFLSNNLRDISSSMEEMKVMLDNLIDTAPKSAKKDERWFTKDVKGFQQNFWDMRHQAFISSAKFNKMMNKTQKEAELLASKVPTPPPSVPGAPPPPSTTPAANPITNLLSQIRQGTSLKKIDPARVQEERSERKGQWRQSVQLLQGLQDTLRDVLDQRHLAMFSDSDSDEDDDEEGWDA